MNTHLQHSLIPTHVTNCIIQRNSAAVAMTCEKGVGMGLVWIFNFVFMLSLLNVFWHFHPYIFFEMFF